MAPHSSTPLFAVGYGKIEKVRTNFPDAFRDQKVTSQLKHFIDSTTSLTFHWGSLSIGTLRPWGQSDQCLCWWGNARTWGRATVRTTCTSSLFPMASLGGPGAGDGSHV